MLELSNPDFFEFMCFNRLAGFSSIPRADSNSGSGDRAFRDPGFGSCIQVPGFPHALPLQTPHKPGIRIRGPGSPVSGPSREPWLSGSQRQRRLWRRLRDRGPGHSGTGWSGRSGTGKGRRAGAEAGWGGGEGPRERMAAFARSSGGSTAWGSGPAEVAAPGTGRAVSPELCVEPGLGGGERRWC